MGGATSVTADPIETRQSIMQSVGAAAKISGNMAKGELAFDPDVAMAALTTFVAAGRSFPAFFPEGSESGGDTRAKDTIWSDNAGFVAASEKLANDASAAVAAKPADLDAFRSAFSSVAENCQSCHEDYRIAQN
jgi:cytochrome c556